MRPLGIWVTIVEPGYFRTDFLDASSLDTAANVIADYEADRGGRACPRRGRQPCPAG
ncbi:hypothetical protein [Mycobacterium tilburgii]|uniref:hypothetical protein n=1 Tax=Mycobacterium tilburgii TaxID=44467 RepID=UPI0021B2B7DF|nr:hypothetical protein [Mycobacterium tilburgii]